MVDQQVCRELEATGSFGYMDLDVDEVCLYQLCV